MKYGKRICEKYDKLWIIMQNNKNWCFIFKLLHGIHDSTGHVHYIVINNIVYQNFQFIFIFLDITHFVGIYE